MTRWLDALDNPDSVRAIFGEATPSLDVIALHEVCIHRDGPTLTLRFDFNEFPAHPPKKWGAQGFNVVQVKMDLIGVQKLALHGLSTDSRVDLILEKQGEMIEAKASGTTILEVSAQVAVITSLSAYRSEPES